MRNPESLLSSNSGEIGCYALGVMSEENISLWIGIQYMIYMSDVFLPGLHEEACMRMRLNSL